MGFIERVKGFMFQKSFEDEYEDEYEIEEELIEDDIPLVGSKRKQKIENSDTIVLSPLAKSDKAEEGRSLGPVAVPPMIPQIVLSCPKNIEEAVEVCAFLRQNKSVVVNLEAIEIKEGQRIVDFLAGVAEAIDGSLQSITPRIYITAPKYVDITDHVKEHLKVSGVFNGLGFRKSK
jgi:cell division inhibitor SepF